MSQGRFHPATNCGNFSPPLCNILQKQTRLLADNNLQPNSPLVGSKKTGLTRQKDGVRHRRIRQGRYKYALQREKTQTVHKTANTPDTVVSGQKLYKHRKQKN
jgi:hypothetical protein